MKDVFVDMDGVLADFDAEMRYLRHGPWDRKGDAPEMYHQHFFSRLPVVPGARQAITDLLVLERAGLAKLYIATMPVRTLWCAGEKQKWIEEHFPELEKRVLLICDKRLLRGDYLIDDDHEDRWHKVFQGRFMKFDHEHPVQSWQQIVRVLVTELKP